MMQISWHSIGFALLVSFFKKYIKKGKAGSVVGVAWSHSVKKEYICFKSSNGERTIVTE